MDPADVGYRGLWRRRLLRDASGEDRDTRVWWLQGDGWYVDLRIPPDRPDFTGVTGFEQLNAEQIAWLARQQGFAGRLVIDGNRLHWQRHIDLQPPTALADIGEVYWDGECLHERGVLADYAEEWVWQRPASSISGVWATPDRRGLRVAVGEWVMQAVDRRSPLGQITRLTDLAVAPGADPSSLLNCAIEFGHAGDAGNNWNVLYSSLPWRAGRSAAELEGQHVDWEMGVALEARTRPHDG